MSCGPRSSGCGPWPKTSPPEHYVILDSHRRHADDLSPVVPMDSPATAAPTVRHMAEVRTYLETAGTPATPSLVRIDAQRVAIDWRRADVKLVTRQLLSNAEAVALGAAVTAFMEPAPEPVPEPAPESPPAPLDAPLLRGTIGDGSIDLAWTITSPNVRRFAVWLNDQWAAQVAADVRSWRTAGLPSGVPVTARVVAYDDITYRNSNTITLTPTGAPAPTPPPPPPSTEPRGTLVLDEQFSGPLDTTSRWGVYTTPANHSSYPGIRAARAITVQDGQLVITASYDPATGQITTGGMSHRLDWRYGTVEARVRADWDPSFQLSGVLLRWPETLTRPDGSKDHGDPGEGELDFWETTRSSDGLSKAYLHYAGTENRQVVVPFGVRRDVWQTVRMDVDPDAVTLSIDGMVKRRVTDSGVLATLARRGHLAIQFDVFGNRKDSSGRLVGYNALPSPLRMEVAEIQLWTR